MRFLTFIALGILAGIAYASMRKHVRAMKKQHEQAKKAQAEDNMKRGGELEKDPETGHYKPKNSNGGYETKSKHKR